MVEEWQGKLGPGPVIPRAKRVESLRGDLGRRKKSSRAMRLLVVFEEASPVTVQTGRLEFRSGKRRIERAQASDGITEHLAG